MGGKGWIGFNLGGTGPVDGDTRGTLKNRLAGNPAKEELRFPVQAEMPLGVISSY